LPHSERDDVTRKSPPDELSAGPTVTKHQKKLRRLILWGSVAALFLGAGTVACGLLSEQTDTTKAILLFIAALVGGAGCIYSFYRCLREISPKPKRPFISTLH
jgi:hypothetical protein